MASYQRQFERIVVQVGSKTEYESTNVQKYLQGLKIRSLRYVMGTN